MPFIITFKKLFYCFKKRKKSLKQNTDIIQEYGQGPEKFKEPRPDIHSEAQKVQNKDYNL